MKKAVVAALVAGAAWAGYSENTLDENEFWNKETAYQAATPTTSEATLEGENDFEFSSVGEMCVVFPKKFVSAIARFFLLFE